MKTSKTSAKPRQLTAVELVAIGLLLVAVRIVSGQLSGVLLEQLTVSSPSLMSQKTLHISASHLVGSPCFTLVHKV